MARSDYNTRIGLLLGPLAAMLSIGGLTRAIGQEPLPAESPKVVVSKPISDEAPELPTLPQPPATNDPAAPVANASIRLPKTMHPWGRFAPGAWRTLRTTTESFDPAGKFLGRSESVVTETLVGVSDGAYTIESITVLEIGGKQLRGAGERITKLLLTDETTPVVATEVLAPVELTIEDRVISCQRWQLVLGEGDQQRVATLFYNPDVAPFILRREIVHAEGSDSVFAATTHVSRVDVPVVLAGESEEIVPGEYQAYVSLSGTLRVDRTDVTSRVVPGGLISATTTERDASGRRVRWSTCELVDYGQAGEEPAPRRRWRLFRRRGS